MSLPIPLLDNKDFDALFEQARSLIPRYAPAWTDHNTHDPGITLLELVAWIIDQEIYQAGFVSDRHFEAFAALLGVNKRYARAAQGSIWPPHDPINQAIAAAGFDLDAGAKVVSSDQPELVFQTSSAIHICPAKFASVEGNTDEYIITAQNSRRHVAIPLWDRKHGQPQCKTYPMSIGSFDDLFPKSIVLVFDRPLVKGNGGDSIYPLSLGIELDGLGEVEADSPPLPGELIIDYRIDRPGEPWRRVDIVKDSDSTRVLNNTGLVLFNLPQQALGDGSATTSRLRLGTRGRVNPVPARIKHIALNVLPVEQLETRKKKPFTRRSDGLPNEWFELDLEGLTGPDEVQIQVEQQNVLQDWRTVQDITQAGPDDQVYELRLQDNQIIFGNGINGMIPTKDAQVRHLDYRLTKGAAGNLGPGLNWIVKGAPPLAGGEIFGSNRYAVKGGEDASDLEELRAEARKQALERRVLLTDSELGEAAKGLDGMNVAVADVLAGFFPGMPHHTVPGTRALIVTPVRPREIGPMAGTPDHYIAAIENTLAPRRVLGERLSVLAAERVPIKVSAKLLIEDGANGETVANLATLHLNARLSDIKSSELTGIEHWPIGRTVSVKEMKALLATVPSVIAIPDCRIAGNDDDYSHADLQLERYQIAIGRKHDIQIDVFKEKRG